MQKHPLCISGRRFCVVQSK